MNEAEAKVKELEAKLADRKLPKDVTDMLLEYGQMKVSNSELEAEIEQLKVGRTNAGDATNGTVKRFGFDCTKIPVDIIPATNGASVWFSDYCKLYKEREQLQAQLSKFQTSEFNPDWSMLQASQESLREHMAMVKELQAQVAMLVNTLDYYSNSTRLGEVGSSRGRHIEEVDDGERARMAITAFPSNYIEKIVLEARIDEQEKAIGMRATDSCRRVKELRAQLATLEEVKK
jgi:hypothetical protein